MSSRWYRSRLFWLGLVGLAALLLGWFAFPRTQVEASYGMRLGRFEISKGDGLIRFSYQHPSSPFLPVTNGFEFTHYEQFSGYSTRLLAPAFGVFGSVGWYGVHFGIWAIVLIYVLTWLGGMIWWQRRKHRLMDCQQGPAISRTGEID